MLNYGDLGKRIVAWIIDSLVVGLLGAIIVFGLNLIGLWVVALIISPVISWLYYILMEGGNAHATIGKQVMGLYVAYEDGRGISYSTAILRLIGKMLSGLILGIGYLMGFFDDKKQCLHDMIAKTYVLSGVPNGARRGGPPQIVGVNGPLAGMVYSVNDSGLLIGRDSISCQVVVPSSQTKVSRIHCYVTYNPLSETVIVNDRNSTHGTFLSNGRRIAFEYPAALKRGERFYLASPENTFEIR